MRYLTLPEALLIAEAVTGTPSDALRTSARLDLLDSALNAPRAGFGDLDLYPSLTEKAAVLAVRIAKNHPLMDGNKRLAWMSLRMFCALNEVSLVATADEAVAIMLRVAAGDEDELSLARWITEHLES